jgi:hypothetical protein
MKVVRSEICLDSSCHVPAACWPAVKVSALISRSISIERYRAASSLQIHLFQILIVGLQELMLADSVREVRRMPIAVLLQHLSFRKIVSIMGVSRCSRTLPAQPPQWAALYSRTGYFLPSPFITLIRPFQYSLSQ